MLVPLGKFLYQCFLGSTGFFLVFYHSSFKLLLLLSYFLTCLLFFQQLIPLNLPKTVLKWIPKSKQICTLFTVASIFSVISRYMLIELIIISSTFILLHFLRLIKPFFCQHKQKSFDFTCRLIFSSLAKDLICCISIVSGFLLRVKSSWLPIHKSRICFGKKMKGKYEEKIIIIFMAF